MLAIDLPGEVISLIFMHIHSNYDIHECMKVCKKWYRVGSVKYYRPKIILANNHTKFLKRCLMIHIDGKRMGDFLEELLFCPMENTPKEQALTQDQFGLLISSLPRLQALGFDYEDDQETVINYIEYFNSIAKDTNIEEFYINELMEDDLAHEYQEKNENSELVRHWHYTINRTLCDRITKFSLYNLNIPSLKGDRLLRDLADFTSLKRFALRVASSSRRYYGSETILHVSKVLNVCPNLESLRFHSPIPWSDSTSYSMIYNDLTTLTLETPKLSQDNVQFLVRHVPNLKKLQMTFNSMCLGELHSILDSHTLDLLVKYLKRINSLIMIGSTNSNERPTALLSFWNLVRDLYNTDSECNLDITFQPAAPSSYDQEIHLDQFRNIITVCYRWVIQEQIERGWVRYIDFLNISKLQIKLNEDVHPQGIYSVDIIDPNLLKNQPDAMFIWDGRTIRFSPPILKTILVYAKPVIRHAFFTDLQPNHNDLLKTISACYPLIDSFTIEDWMYPTEVSNQYHIDLRPFTNLQRLAIEFGQVYGEFDYVSDVYLQITADDTRIDHYYHYRYGQRNVKHISNLPQQIISGNKMVVRISCARSVRLFFDHNSEPLQIVEAN